MTYFIFFVFELNKRRLKYSKKYFTSNDIYLICVQPYKKYKKKFYF